MKRKLRHDAYSIARRTNWDVLTKASNVAYAERKPSVLSLLTKSELLV